MVCRAVTNHQTQWLQDQFIKLMREALPDTRWGTRYDYWSGWLRTAAYTVHQMPYHTGQLEPDDQFEAIEQRYMEQIKGCSKEQLDLYKRLYHLTQYALHLNPWTDFLGQIYHRLELEDRDGGQSFTPPDASRLIAALLADDSEEEHGGLRQQLEGRNLISVSEDACGSGGMVLSFAGHIAEMGHDPVNRLMVMLTDIDPNCFDMAYIQCSMTGLMALVRLGDTLTQQIKEVRATPTLRCFWAWTERVGLDKAWRDQELCRAALRLEEMPVAVDLETATDRGRDRSTRTIIGKQLKIEQQNRAWKQMSLF